MSTATPMGFRSGPGNPCPVCGAGSKGCSATDDGLHFCRGADAPPDGWFDVRRGREDSQGFRHYRRRDDSAPNAAPRPTRRRTVKPTKPKKFTSEEKGVALPLAFRQKLADCLRLPVEATFALPMGWADGEWRWPELNGDGEVVGIARRFATGDKCMVDGSHRGVVVFGGWKDRPGPVLVCEGMSDGLAATAAGFGALSRANAKDGSAHLPGLLKGVPADRDIVFVLDPDADGTLGGNRVAANVAADLGRPVKVAPTPAGFKDLRAYLTAPTWGDTPWAERGEQLGRHIGDAARPVDSGAAGEEEGDPPAAPPGTVPPAVADAGFEQSPYPWGRHPFTDHGNARRLMHLSGEDVLYIDPWERWYVWDGLRWKADTTLEIGRLAARATHGIWWEAAAAPNANAREAAERWWFLSQSAGRQRAMASLARDMAAADYETFDQQPELFNAANGTIDLATGELREADRADRLTVRSPVNYDPAAACPVWESTLAQIFARNPDDPAAGGDAELIEFVHRLFGCCLTGHSPPILPIFWGTGANGKSLVVRIVSHVLGRDYAVSVANEVLMEGTDQHPTGLADLYAKRVAFCVETNDGQSLNASLVKQLTGGDRIRARRMRQDYWEFPPTHTLILCTNHRPRVPGDDAAVWRRLALVPFRCVFWNPEKDETGPEHRRQDRDLEKKLLAEAEGILAWLVCGATKFLRDGLPTPKVVTEQTKEYRASEDVIGQFLEEHVKVVKGAKVLKRTLYEAYRKWAEGEGLHPVSANKFGAAMGNKGHREVRWGAGRFWDGIDLDNLDEISREFDEV